MTNEVSMIPEGFNRPDTNSALVARSSAAAAATARAELEAAVAMARMYPRDEHKALTAMLTAAKRPEFAEDATYEFPRGGQTISGPSVSLARPLATYWGHIRAGYRVVDDDGDDVTLEGFCNDMQTGTSHMLQDRFKKLVQRKNKATGKAEWVKPDERDQRELYNRRGAILIRNCILAIIPPDIVSAVLRQCTDTMHAASTGKLKENREDTLRKMVVAWADIGVTKEMLEQQLGHPIEQISPQEHVRIQGWYRSIRDGNTKVSDHFDYGQAAPTAGGHTPTARIDLAKAKEGVAVDPPGGTGLFQAGAPIDNAALDRQIAEEEAARETAKGVKR